MAGLFGGSKKTENGTSLPFCPLRSPAGLLETRLLALDRARVAREELLGLERRTNERVVLHESASDTELHRISLTRESTARNENGNLGRFGFADDLERCDTRFTLLESIEVFGVWTIVHDDLERFGFCIGIVTNLGDRRLATADRVDIATLSRKRLPSHFFRLGCLLNRCRHNGFEN